MTNERPLSPDGATDLDWWASRLVDHEIEFADVPADLRADVQERARRFAEVRGTLLRGATSKPDPAVVDRALTVGLRPLATTKHRRSFVMPLVAAAALVAVVAIGARLVVDDRSDPTVTADASPTAMATEPIERSAMVAEAAPTDLAKSGGAPIDVATVDEIVALVRTWVGSTPPPRDVPRCPNDTAPALDVALTYGGVTAEIHYAEDAGVVVLAVDDCRVLVEVPRELISG